MAKKNATDIAMYVAGVKIAGATSAEVSREMSPRDATSKDSGGNSESLEGLKSWTMSGEGFIDPAATYGFDELDSAYDTRTPISVRWSSETSTEKYYQGMAYIDSLSGTAGVEETATFSFSLTGTGVLSYVTLT